MRFDSSRYPAVFAIAMMVSFCAPSEAAEYLVDNPDDGADQDINDGRCVTREGFCSLRAAIQQANARRGLDRVVVPEGIYSPSVAATGESGSGGSGFHITDDLLLVGAGAEKTVITGAQGRFRVIRVSNKARVTIKDVTLTQGRAGEQGAVVYSSGSLALVGVTIASAGADSSAVFNDKGMLVVSGSRVRNNFQGITTHLGEVLVDGSEFAGNFREGGDGAAILSNHSRVTIAGSTFSGNRAVRGGAIYTNDQLTITNSSFQDNHATLQTRIPGGGGALYVAGSGVASLQNTRITGNSSARDGGGIYAGGKLVLSRVIVEGNRALQGKGGGICFSLREKKSHPQKSASTSSDLVVAHSLVATNRAKSGAGIYFKGAVAVVENSTLSGNQALQAGGGVYNLSRSNAVGISLRNVTLSGNRTVPGRGGNITNGKGQLTLMATLLDAPADGGGNCSGTISSLGYNLDSDGSCNLTGKGDISGVAVSLDILSGNGDTIVTHALKSGSPAIDVVPVELCPDLDQRFHYRKGGAQRCDIGAFEAGSRRAASGVLSFRPVRYEAVEADAPVRITVAREGGAEGAVAVEYFDTASGSARHYSRIADYRPLSKGMLYWSDGDNEDKTITIDILDDTAKERDETIVIALGDTQGGAGVGEVRAVITILDDDSVSTTPAKGSEVPKVPGNAENGTAGATDSGGTTGDTAPSPDRGGGGGSDPLLPVAGLLAMLRRRLCLGRLLSPVVVRWYAAACRLGQGRQAPDLRYSALDRDVRVPRVQG